MRSVLLCTVLVLAACGVTAPTNIDSTSASSDPSSHSSPVFSSSHSVGSPESSPMLDRIFSSRKLGIEFRYPSYVYCDEKVPVTAVESDFFVEFVISESNVQRGCSPPPPIYGKRATTEEEVRDFVAKVFPAFCVIDEEYSFQEYGIDEKINTHAMIRITPEDYNNIEQHFACGSAVTWNKELGVVWYAQLFQKNSGYLWGVERLKSDNSQYDVVGADIDIAISFKVLK